MPQNTGSAVPPDGNHLKRDARTNLQAHLEKIRDSCRHESRRSPEWCPSDDGSPGSGITIPDLSPSFRDSWIRITRCHPARNRRSLTDLPRDRDVGRSPAVTDRRSISHRSHAEPLDRRTDRDRDWDRDQDRERDRYFSHARVTRPPTTKVTRRPVATPAWRVARRVLERGRRDDRRRGGRIDEGGGMLEREGKKTRRGVESNRTGKKEWKRRSGSERVESYRRKERTVPTVPLHPRIKNRSASPICTLSPLIRAGCCAVSGTQCTTDTEIRTRSWYQTDNVPRHIVHREPRRCKEIKIRGNIIQKNI